MRSNNPPFTLIYLCQDICRLIREGFIYLVDKGISSKQARYITILEPSVISLAFDVHVIFKMCRYRVSRNRLYIVRNVYNLNCINANGT